MRWIVVIVVALALAAGLAGWSGAPSSDHAPVVATAGEVEVTAKAFRVAYVAYLLRTGLPDRPRLRRVFLDDLLASKLLVQETRAAGIAQEAPFRFRQEQVRQKLLLDAYAQAVLFDTLAVTDGDLSEAFRRMHTQVKARHLYAGTRAQADLLYARLQAGETFEALAKEVFADPSLAEHGGALGYFGFDEMDPAFEDAAFALRVGEISEPVRTAQGYSILQVQDRFTNPLLTETDFAKQRPKLVPFVRYRKQQQARQRHARALEDELALSFHEAFEGLFGRVIGQALAPGDEALAAWLDAPLVSFGPPAQRRTWTVGDFRDRARFTDERQRARVRTRDDLAAFVAGLVMREAMTERARQRGLDETPAYAQALGETMDAWVLQTARERLAADVDIPEDSVRAFFLAAGSQAFLVPERVRVGEVVVATKAEADFLKAQASYAAFEALARAYSIRSETRPVGGDLGFLSRDRLGALADVVFGAAEGTVLGPFEVQGQYVLLRSGARQPARQMPYEEAQEAIRAQLQRSFERAHLREAYAAIRARYAVQVDSKLLLSMSLRDEDQS